MEDYTQKA